MLKFDITLTSVHCAGLKLLLIKSRNKKGYIPYPPLPRRVPQPQGRAAQARRAVTEEKQY